MDCYMKEEEIKVYKPTWDTWEVDGDRCEEEGDAKDMEQRE